jgi:hypothetical protein
MRRRFSFVSSFLYPLRYPERAEAVIVGTSRRMALV